MANICKVRGWLRQRERAGGMTWLWCHQRLREGDGAMVENTVSLGLVLSRDLRPSLCALDGSRQ